MRSMFPSFCTICALAMLHYTLVDSTQAFAGSADEDQAEMVRVLEDMKKFQKRNSWDVVEKKYQELLTYKKGVPTYEMHFLGALAASNRGDVGTVKERLELALAQQEVAEGREWYTSIDANYAKVLLKVPGKIESIPELQIASVPFFPEQQQAIAFSQQQLQENRKFEGYLPFGDYTLGFSKFTVAPGQAMQTVVASDTVTMASNQTDKPDTPKTKTPISIAVTPRVDLGFALSQAGEDDTAMTAVSFGGMGSRVGVGSNIFFTDKIGLVAEVGYNGIFAGGEEPASKLATEFGYQASPTKYNGTFGWLGASFATPSMQVTVGPVVEYAVVETQGLNVAGLEYAVAKGSLVSAGVSGSIGYYAFGLGEKLQGGFSTQVGSQTDGSRMYNWGQIAFSIRGK